jgi:hypothetical protein
MISTLYLPSRARATVWRTWSSVPWSPTRSTDGIIRHSFERRPRREVHQRKFDIPHFRGSHAATFLLQSTVEYHTLSTFRAASCRPSTQLPMLLSTPVAIGGISRQTAWACWQCQPGDGCLCPDSLPLSPCPSSGPDHLTSEVPESGKQAGCQPHP